MQLDDRDYVFGQYRTTDKLETRSSVWVANDSGTTPQDVAVAALSEVHPRHVLEVGAGNGNLALRIAEEIQCDVVALDSSSVMVAASSALGVKAILGDVCDLPFPNDSFDAVVAAWMLYHVHPLEQGLSELARVLRPGGRLVAITNGRAHLKELWTAVGVVHDEPPFSVENGASFLRAYFSKVERHDVSMLAAFHDRDAAAAYLSSLNQDQLVDRLPKVDWPLRAQGATAVFIADKAN